MFLGSVLNQVLLHQSIIGLETKAATRYLRVIRCESGYDHRLRRRRFQPGRSDLSVYGEMLRGERDYQFIAVEPASCPSLTRGKYVYDFCDTGMVTPLAKMYTLGSGFIPSANHAGGLRYHGMSSVLSQLYADGLMEARAVSRRRYSRRRKHSRGWRGSFRLRKAPTPSESPLTRL